MALSTSEKQDIFAYNQMKDGDKSTAKAARRFLPGKAGEAERCEHVVTGTLGTFSQTECTTWGIFRGDNGTCFTASRGDVWIKGDIVTPDIEIDRAIAQSGR